MTYAHCRCDRLLIGLGYSIGLLALSANINNLQFRSSDYDEDKYMVCVCKHTDTGNSRQTPKGRLGFLT